MTPRRSIVNVRTLLVALLLCVPITWLGLVCLMVYSHDGPEFFYYLCLAFIPGGFIVQKLTGRQFGVDNAAFLLFLVLQYAYAYVLVLAGPRSILHVSRAFGGALVGAGLGALAGAIAVVLVSPVAEQSELQRAILIASTVIGVLVGLRLGPRYFRWTTALFDWLSAL